MQRKRTLLRENENTNQTSFIPTDVLRAHKGIAQQFKFKERNQNATDIYSVINSLHDTFYNLIHNNRDNTIQEITIRIPEHLSKPREVINDRDLVDLSTGITHRRGTISIPTDERIYDDKYHHRMFSLYTLEQALESYWMI